MEPLKVACTTCGRKLRIRDHRLIGQIIACPKCEGMVLVSAPGEVSGREVVNVSSADTLDRESLAPEPEAVPRETPPGGFGPRLEVGNQDVDSEAVTREGLAPDAIFAETELRNLEGVQGPLKAVWGGDTGLSNDGELPREDLPGGGGTFPTDTIHGPNVLPPVAWQSESSARTRQIAAIIAIAVTSLLIVTTAFVLVVRSWKQSRDGEQVAEVVIPSSDILEERNREVGLSKDGDGAAESGAIQPAVAEQGSERPPGAGPGEVQPGRSDNQPSPLSNEAMNGGSDPLEPSSSGESVAGEEAIGAEPTGQPKAEETPSLPSPDELFPDAPVRENLLVSPPEAGAEEEGGAAMELPPELAQYVQQLQLSRPSEVAARNPLHAPPTMEELRVRRPELEFSSSDYPLPSEKLDVRKQMAVKLLGVDAQSQPMSDLLLVISQLSACPIQVDWLGLEISGISLDQAITLTEKDIEVGPLLRRVTDQAGARLGLSDGFVLIGAGMEAASTALLKCFDLSDLEHGVGIDPGVLRLMIGSADELEVRIEAPTLIVEGSEEAKWRAALVVEAIRRGRKLPPKLSGSLQRWMVEVSDYAMDEGLGFAQWLPLPAEPMEIDNHRAESVPWVLSRLARESKAFLVFDWGSAWEHGLTPSAKVLPWYRGRGADQIAAEVLEPYGMKVWDAGGGAWWAGTEQAYLEMPLIMILGGGDKDQSGRIEEVVIGAAGQTVGASSVWRDPVSQKVIAVLPRYIIQEIPGTLRGAMTP